ncbi:helix-turn-helix domain-containing protein [Streptomyces sp. Agncl-13]|uniref:helix-turn-helix domain-containing protein n=1 Tax=Streptomyces sp. Agncl-13 TaxID=3400628 RepID=UPI003A83ED12
MSPDHFQRSFRAAYGETPYSCLMTRRIEWAKALLRRGDLSVTEVCMAVGCSTTTWYGPSRSAASSGGPTCAAVRPSRDRSRCVTQARGGITRAGSGLPFSRTDNVLEPQLH